MDNPNISLTKICTTCGQRKPLSAFLQLAGQQGSTYGNVCATCRKTTVTTAKEPEESTTSTTGFKIDSKTKVKGEVDKREFRKQIEDDYFDGRDKQEEKQVKQTQKSLHFAKDQKKHRDNFLTRHSNNSKQSYSNPPVVFGGEEHKTQAAEMDFAKGPVDISRVAGQIKQHSSVFQSFKKWLGNAAPITSAAERATQQNPQDKNKSSAKTAMDKLTDMSETYRPRTRK